jgi:tetratricopeptide (TPR) repeat protein
LGDLEGALADAKACVSVRKSWASARPKDAYATYYFLTARQQEAYVADRRGDDEEALPELKRILDGYASLLRDDPSQLDFSLQRSDALGLLCDIRRRVGELALGKNDCDMAAKISEDILRKSPRVGPRLGVPMNAAAAMQLARGDRRAALSVFSRNSELLESSAGLIHETLHDDALVDALVGVARAELALGDVDGALRDVSGTRNVIGAYVEDSPHNVLRLDRATTFGLLSGDVSLARSDPAGAREAYEEARRGCASLLERGPDDANVKLHCAEAYAKLATQMQDAKEAQHLRVLAVSLLSKLDPRLVKTAARDLPAVTQ